MNNRNKREFIKGTIQNVGPSKFVKSGKTMTIREDEGPLSKINSGVLFDCQDCDFDPEVGQQVEFCIWTEYLDNEKDKPYDDAYQITHIDEDKGLFYAQWIESPYLGFHVGDLLEDSCIADAALDRFFVDDFDGILEVGYIFRTKVKSEIRLVSDKDFSPSLL